MPCVQFLILETDLSSKVYELNQAVVEMKGLRQSLASLRDENKALRAVAMSQIDSGEVDGTRPAMAYE